ncbi:XRE family transcriptional regulator [Rathayibacter caricis DSM 15933]|jgi:transcriptional regulator with XRE-family HTH domain|uniref:XRE family transcriptional regulator n=1 Tax=Rathayibacter caricis DSM 15933 TaxID=1328867 RepID=A0A2T4UPT2_9MICO|nr:MULTISPECIES: helix-turn-helix transcriptional regulator [Rathayibacter]KQQ20927.1 XRE family transcriptional regulator [Rathayibacter sp. Leaf299]PTL71542.1 XRE family transcriptional regulator [Rathayibacter caricis DSM 15933]
MSTPLPERDWAEYARELGTNLHRARMAKNESQERIAHAAGLAGYTYQKFEKGESKPGSPANPQLKTLFALCEALDVELADLLPPNPPRVSSRDSS